jgi:hypothetical protein
MTSASAAFVLSGAFALVLALLSEDARMELAVLAVIGAALGLALLAAGERMRAGQPLQPPPDEPEPVVSWDGRGEEPPTPSGG